MRTVGKSTDSIECSVTPGRYSWAGSAPSVHVTRWKQCWCWCSPEVYSEAKSKLELQRRSGGRFPGRGRVSGTSTGRCASATSEGRLVVLSQRRAL